MMAKCDRVHFLRKEQSRDLKDEFLPTSTHIIWATSGNVLVCLDANGKLGFILLYQYQRYTETLYGMINQLESTQMTE